ncbi:MAG: ABC transporter substrate-binding protein [Nitrososphaera sp.]|jgi:peptide/nickel transport system substrate-binding protein
MKFVIAILMIIILSSNVAFSEKGTYFNQIKFIQYSDDNTALEEVNNGNLGMYFYAIPSDIIDEKSRQDLKIFESTGTSYSLLVNPAKSDKFNPFSIKDVRFALNYLVNRDLIVDELLNGYGLPMISAYKPNDPDYLLILNELQSFNFRYDPSFAENMMSNALQSAGAQKIDGKWYYNSKPIELTIFIRNDDPIRKSIGEIISSQLQEIGFTVSKDYGDLTKAFSVVYGSNPADLKWSIYTEAWSMSGFVKYDSVMTAQMYSPWFSNMPGFNNPSYWNYQNPEIDSVSQAIFVGNFTSESERTNLIKKAVSLGVEDSVRIFLACKTDQYVTNKKIQGVINDFGAGITSRFSLINSRSDSDILKVGVKKIYQGAWNPVAGFTDSYSRYIWDVVSDSGSYKNPYTGITIPVRSTWEVETKGPLAKIDVPTDVILWNATEQKWVQVGPGITATSKVTFHYDFGNWHNGQPMDMNDVLYGIYFLYQWGANNAAEMKTFDSEFSPKANQAIKTLVGIRVIDKNTIEVYQNFWHFDNGEIADSAQVWPGVPWEITYSMEKAVMDGKLAFSRSDAVNNNVNWLSLIIPDDANVLESYLAEFDKEKTMPVALQSLNYSYADSRYQASISWINTHHNAVISNGPFYLDSYSPEARTITIKSFDDASYPLEAGHWAKFENVDLPRIKNIDFPKVVQMGQNLTVPITTTTNATLYYYFTNSQGVVIDQNKIFSDNGTAHIFLNGQQTEKFDEGSNNLQLFVVSDDAYKPDIFRTSFLATNSEFKLVEQNKTIGTETPINNYNVELLVILAIILGSAIAVMMKRSKRRT